MCAWAAPPTAVTGNVITAADFNTLRDDINESLAAKVTTAGDIGYATGANALARLAIGAATTVLHGGASAPSYSAVVAGDLDANALWTKTPPLALAFRTADQTLTNDTWTNISFDTEDYDTDTIFAATSVNLTAQRTGYYLLAAHVLFAANATGNRGIRFQGIVPHPHEVRVPTVSDGAQTGLTSIVLTSLSAASAFQVQAYQNSTGNLDITDASAIIVRLA